MMDEFTKQIEVCTKSTPADQIERLAKDIGETIGKKEGILLLRKLAKRVGRSTGDLVKFLDAGVKKATELPPEAQYAGGALPMADIEQAVKRCDGYSVTPEWIVYDDEEKETTHCAIRPCLPLFRKSDETTENHGLVLRFWTDATGQWTTKTITIDIGGLHDGDRSAIGALERAGLSVEHRDSAAKLLLRFAHDSRLPRILEFSRPGWHLDYSVFIDPFGNVHPPREAGQMAVTLGPDKGFAGESDTGTMQGSLDVMRAVWSDDSEAWWRYLSMTGVSGTIRQLCAEETGGGGIVGGSGLGKSVGFGVGASFWGPATPDGQGCLMKGDLNLPMIEIAAQKRTGTVQYVDDLKNLGLNAAHLESMMFAWHNGSGKDRMKRSADGQRPTARFNVSTFYASEYHAADIIKKATRAEPAIGSINRFPEIGMPVRDRRRSDDPGLAAVRDAIHHTGHIGPAFVDHLLARRWNSKTGRAALVRLITRRTIELAGEGNQNLERAARSIALVWVCGTLLHRFGFMPGATPQTIEDTARWGWDAFLTGAQAPRLEIKDMAETALQAIRKAIIDGRIVSAGSITSAPDQPRAPRQGIIGIYGTTYGIEWVAIYRGKLGDLVTGRTEKDIRKALNTAGRIERDGDHWTRSTIPGVGAVEHYRITGRGLLPVVDDEPDAANLSTAEKMAAAVQTIGEAVDAVEEAKRVAAYAKAVAMAEQAERAFPDDTGTVH